MVIDLKMCLKIANDKSSTKQEVPKRIKLSDHYIWHHFADRVLHQLNCYFHRFFLKGDYIRYLSKILEFFHTRQFVFTSVSACILFR